jgi:hypothetical protein
LGFDAIGVRSILNCPIDSGIAIAEISLFLGHQSQNDRAGKFVEYGTYADVID